MASQPPNSPKQTGFFDHSPELRDAIYELICHGTTLWINYNIKATSSVQVAPLLLVCRQMHREYLLILLHRLYGKRYDARERRRLQTFHSSLGSTGSYAISQ